MSAVNRRRKSEDEILDLDYLAHNSSLDGMLSHLKPELRTAFQQTGSSLPALNPVYGPRQLPTTSAPIGLSVETTPASVISGDTPMGHSPRGHSIPLGSNLSTSGDTPVGISPMGLSSSSASDPTTPNDAPMGVSTPLAADRTARGDTPVGLSPMGPSTPSASDLTDLGETPMGHQPPGASTALSTNQTALSDTPVGLSPMGSSALGATTPSDPPMGHPPMGLSESLVSDRAAPGDTPTGHLPSLASGHAIQSGTLSDEPTRRIPVTENPALEEPDFVDQSIGDAHQPSDATAAYDIAGVGKRRFHRCRNVQDGHTNGEQVAYTTIWSYAKRYGHHEEEGSYLIDLSIARFCQLISTDHKHARKLLDNLEAKLAIAIAKPPNFRLNSPTSYRVFNYSQILERRNAAGLIWVVRNRATQFISPEQVSAIVSDKPLGLSPTGLPLHTIEQPMGRRPEEPAGRKPEKPTGHKPLPILIEENLARKPEGKSLSPSSSSQLVEAVVIAVAQILPVDDGAAKIALAKADPTLKEGEAVHFARQAATKVTRQKNATNPTGLWITQFAGYASGTPLKLYRAQSATEKATFQQMGMTDEDWTAILKNPDVVEEQRVLARRMLDVSLQQNP